MRRGGPDEVSGTQPSLASYKASTQPTELSGPKFLETLSGEAWLGHFAEPQDCASSLATLGLAEGREGTHLQDLFILGLHVCHVGPQLCQRPLPLSQGLLGRFPRGLCFLLARLWEAEEGEKGQDGGCTLKQSLGSGCDSMVEGMPGPRDPVSSHLLRSGLITPSMLRAQTPT